MDVYLVQHGVAVSAEEDPARPLSDAGRRTVTKVAEYAAALGGAFIDPPITEVWHSGKLRAEQTAQILAPRLAPAVTPRAHRGMKPNDDATGTFEELSTARDRPGALLLVGHLPHLERLAGLLLTGAAENSPVRFVNAALLRVGFRDGHWRVDCYVTPACVPRAPAANKPLRQGVLLTERDSAAAVPTPRVSSMLGN